MSQPLLLDTNVLLVYLVGLYNPSLISTFEKTSSYDEQSFNMIKHIVHYHKTLIVNSYIATEISNLSSQFHSKNIDEYYVRLVNYFSSVNENTFSLKYLCSNTSAIIKFGFTDVSILELASKNSVTVLSDDWALVTEGISKNLNFINFRNLQGKNWFNNYITINKT